MERVLEPDLEVVAQVGAAPRPAARIAAAEAAAEDGLEDVAEVAEIGLLPAPALLEGGVAEAVVSGALLRVLEALVGRADGLELGLVVLAPLIAVGVELHRQLAIGGLDRRPVGGAADAEHFVKIGFHRRHVRPPPESLAVTGADCTGGGRGFHRAISPCCLRRLRRTRRRRLPPRSPKRPPPRR